MPLICLEYHDVVTDTDASGFPGGAAGSYKVTPEAFRAQVAALAGLGVPVVRIDRADAVPARGIALTFDDGGVSAADPTARWLEDAGWYGHFFIASECVGKVGFLDGASLRDLAGRGHVIGSHSRTHPLRMASLTAADQRAEWRDSKAALEDAVGMELPVASVPGGALSNSVIETAAEAGIRVLFTSEPETRVWQHAGCVVVGRYTVRRSHAPSDVAALCRPGGGARARQWVAWNAKKALKRLGGPAYLAVRERIFRA